MNGGPGGLAFLFPGEGSQYPGMLADLCFHFPEVRRLFDTADRIARDLGETVPPSEHLFGPVAGGDEKLWSTATAVNVVLNAQWALYQVLTRLGLRPDAVLGHSSGEILALSAGGVFETDRALERKLGRLGAIMSGFESSGDLPAARLVAVATHRDRVEAICRDLDAGGVDVAMDNCPHQVVLAMPVRGPPTRRRTSAPREHPVRGTPFLARLSYAELPPGRRADRRVLRSDELPSPVCPDLFVCVARADAELLPKRSASSPSRSGPRPWRFAKPSRPCTPTACVCLSTSARAATWPVSSRIPSEASRRSPWPRTCPRRAGLTQLNHLVAATFAHGASLKTDYLYTRRRPRAIDWNAPEPASRARVELKIGFPEMKLSDELIERLALDCTQAVARKLRRRGIRRDARTNR